MEKRKWLFFLHNFIEPNHHALAAGINQMMSFGVDYTFLCKRHLDNPLAKQYQNNEKYTIDNVPVIEDFWMNYRGLHVIYDGKPSLAVCSLAYIYDIPYLISFHGGYDTHEIIYREKMNEKTVNLCNHASRISVVCNKDKELLVGFGINPDIIKIAPPAIDLSILPNLSEKEINPYRIAVVGRLIPKKGIEYAIRALKDLPNKYQLDIVGDGEQKEALLALAKELQVEDRIVWHGQLSLEETLKIMAKDLIYWHPSIVDEGGNADGVPQALVYAMALKRFVVASKYNHIDDLLKPNVNGFICDVKKEGELAKVTLDNVTRYKEIGNEAYLSAKQYSIESQKNVYKEIYDDMEMKTK